MQRNRCAEAARRRIASGSTRPLLRRLCSTARRIALGVAAAAALSAGAARAADPPQPPAPPADAQASALARAHRAVVGLRTLAVADARSNESLGRLRRGSGVVIDGDGLVLTIGYLILEADEVDLLLPGERSVPASVVGYDPATGFGLVRALTPLRIEPAPLGRSAGIGGDEPLLVASAAAGGAQTGGASLARLVSRRDFAGSWEYHIEGALYTAPARVDHSGAGLFSADGELLGIGSLVVANALGDGDRPGTAAAPRLPGNMFVPVDLLLPILVELRDKGTSSLSRRAWLGVNCAEVAGEVRVLRVNADSPAEAAGLKPGDRIEAIDGQPVTALAPFYRRLWSGSPPEREVTLEVRRDGEPRTLTLRAVDRMKVLKHAVGV